MGENLRQPPLILDGERGGGECQAATNSARAYVSPNIGDGPRRRRGLSPSRR